MTLLKTPLQTEIAVHPGEGIPPFCWVMQPHPAGLLHVWPTWDLRSHYLSEHCWCHPVLDEDGVVRHNAADGRERYETGQALRS